MADTQSPPQQQQQQQQAMHAHQHPHAHPHGPQPGAPGGGPGAGMMPGPPPAAAAASAAILDALPVNNVPFALRQPQGQPPRPPGVPAPMPALVCEEHGQVICERCDVDFREINYLGVFMPMLAPGAVPPPPQVQFGKQAEMIKAMRDEGNNEFKAGRYVNAIQLYTRSVERSLSRPPWENTAFTRDEVSSALLNRSAAAGSLGDWVSAYADAEACTKLNAKNAKAYFRKAKALVGMHRLEDAHAVVLTGLTQEPENVELQTFAKDIESQLGPKKAEQIRAEVSVVDESKEEKDGNGEKVDEKTPLVSN